MSSCIGSVCDATLDREHNAWIASRKEECVSIRISTPQSSGNSCRRYRLPYVFPLSSYDPPAGQLKRSPCTPTQQPLRPQPLPQASCLFAWHSSHESLQVQYILQNSSSIASPFIVVSFVMGFALEFLKPKIDHPQHCWTNLTCH